MNLRVDSHMHTPLCGHAVGDPLDYAKAAHANGIDVITITCHIPMEWEAFGQAGTRMQLVELEHYMNMVSTAAIEAKGSGVEVLCGIEAEVYPDASHMDKMDIVLSNDSFDFVLGSLHAHCRSYLLWLEQKNVTSDAAKIDWYFKHLMEGVQSGRYDSMSHPDVIRTDGVVQNVEPAAHEAIIREFLQAVVDQDICMEINTSGLNKGAHQIHPDPLIIDWASEQGVKLTIGSDSHEPRRVGEHFDEIQPWLRSKGFTKLHYFRRRHRQCIEMPEAKVSGS